MLSELSLGCWRCRARLPLRPFLHRAASSIVCPAMASLVQQKRALRSQLRRQLRLQYSSLSLTEDPLIQQHIVEAPWYENSTRICAYISCPSIREVDTSRIISNIFQSVHSDHPKSVYVPWIQDKQSHMKFFHITSYKDLVENTMGILEPSPIDENGIQKEDVMQTDKPIDLILMPGLAFDRAGRRLGRGGGYYDAFLETYLDLAKEKGWRPPLRVGVAYSLQILDEVIPTDDKDVSIDALVTASGVLPISDHFALQNN